MFICFGLNEYFYWIKIRIEIGRSFKVDRHQRLSTADFKLVKEHFSDCFIRF